ncbi:hypothetical protein AB6J97_002108 [Raoultella ornithinolytica]|uniref:hypothetical protein n=1 Tax=Raoultella ornithinolytica TaxID=54291 RepID=UPI000A2D5D8D|nr:hypothetical protein [Raoultella ornithinolytica]ELN4414272.1 hypothetical protein [Raoultella ornithinolytica]SMQ89862.1 Uncharacterised protein [Raoultella ornithinolytica]
MQKRKICFLVVLYNKSIEKSKTLDCLFSINDHHFVCDIVNNGPNTIFFEPNTTVNKDAKFNFIQHIENRPLSVIYNQFISRNRDFSRYVILDDDSSLDFNFIERVFSNENYDLELPKILDQNSNLVFPIIDMKPIDIDTTSLRIDKHVLLSIGSGLILSNNLIGIIKSQGQDVFDANFSLYGVDTSLFLRLRKYGVKNVLITSFSSLNHDLSLHNDQVSEFKLKELYISCALQARRYPQTFTLIKFMKAILKLMRTRRYNLLKIMIFSYFRGTHANSKKYISTNHTLE